MQTYYYNLSGGINQASTKTELGLDTKNIYWTDSKNVEILQNRGIIKQKGNTNILTLQSNEKISAMHELKYSSKRRLVIITISGLIYIYNFDNDTIVLSKSSIPHNKVTFTDYLNGTLIASDTSKLIFLKNDENFTVSDCNLKDLNDEYVCTNILTVYKGRIWAAKESTLYFSALGRFDDFQTENDAGYISNFYTDADEILALKPYKDYLAIYKEKSVYLLSGSNPDDFAIIPFADKGTYSNECIVNVNNKQYFMTDGIYPLEVGTLNQIMIGEDITHKIKSEFEKFDKSRLNEIFVLHYEFKNQIWYFIPYLNDTYFHTIWINDYVNKAWFKRVVPQDITAACVFNNKIMTADKDGKVYIEDYGTTFDGEPIDFMWKSPFLSLGNPSVRKSIDEFYFILDETYENNFTFSVYKNFDSENKDDIEQIYSTNFNNLHWADEYKSLNDVWNCDDNLSLWAVSADTMYKAEISEANYAVQLCVEGNEAGSSAAIIGIEFKEIYTE
ncbi:hypothetical protein IJ818_05995 [bacterium]|nr:hypothetical protein [bacterium]